MKLFGVFKKKIMAGCGHETLVKDRVSAFGASREVKVPVVDGKTDYCHRCLEKMAIKCAWCDGVILIGMPITSYVAKKNFVLPEHSVWFDEEQRLPVGCGRCAEMGPADWTGIWAPPGKVKEIEFCHFEE